MESLLAEEETLGDFLAEPIFTLHGEPVPDEDPNLDRVVGAYRLVRRLGHGGMGTVYLAERADGQFAQRVAVKLIKRGMDTDEILRRFRTERQILANLVHANIARLYDGGTTEDGLPYFVMEYVEGEPIDRYCDGRQALDRRPPAAVPRRLQRGPRRPPEPGRPPRPQARQHPGDRRRRPQAARLRHRQAARRRAAPATPVPPAPPPATRPCSPSCR